MTEAIHSPSSGQIGWPTLNAMVACSEWVAKGMKLRHWSYFGAGLRVPDEGTINFVHWRLLTLRYYGFY